MRYDVRIKDGDEFDVTWCANATSERVEVAVQDILLRDILIEPTAEIIITQTAVGSVTADIDVRNPRTWLDRDRALEWINRRLRT